MDRDIEFRQPRGGVVVGDGATAALTVSAPSLRIRPRWRGRRLQLECQPDSPSGLRYLALAGPGGDRTLRVDLLPGGNAGPEYLADMEYG